MAALPVSGPEDGVAARVRVAHLRMLHAVLAGDGLSGVAAAAARAVGGPVAIVLPRADLAVAEPRVTDDVLAAVSAHAAARVEGSGVAAPPDVLAEAVVHAADGALGIVALVAGDGPADPDAQELLEAAALATLAQVAVDRTRDEVEETVRGGLFDDLRSGREVDRRDVQRRAARLGCDIAHGAVLLCVELEEDRPRHVAAVIAAEHEGAIAQHVEGRIYGLLPAADGEGARERTVQAAQRLAGRLERYGVVGLSGFYADAGELPRAAQEAELVLDVLRHSGRAPTEDFGQGTYRLLFRVLASHPEELRGLYEDTVAAIVRYDEQYRTDLVTTLDTYLERNCNINATASAVYAHRHTVSYRLERIRDLTGLDPTQSEDRERLGLGLKVLRMIEPGLPR